MNGKSKLSNQIFAGIVVLMLVVVMIPGWNVYAANDVTFSKDTTLSAFINRYNNVTVKSGVTVTMKKFSPDPQGLEISGNLVVEEGGIITGPGIIMLEPTSTFSGIDFYYRAQGQENLIPDGNFLTLKPPAPDWKPNMRYSATTGHFVMDGDFNSDPYAVKAGKSPGPNNAVTAPANPAVKALKSYAGNTTEFNAHYYYMNYPDLQSALGTNGDALLSHYNSYGKTEGRIANRLK